MADLPTPPIDRVSARELRFERLLDAPVETVWAYLVEPDLRRRWFMGGMIGQTAGEEIELVMDHQNLSDEPVPTPEAYAPYVGTRWTEEILRIEPPRLLSFTWERGEAGIVTIELAPEGNRTRLVLTHSGLRGRRDALDFGGGWHSHLEVLERRLAGLRIENFWKLHSAAEAKMAAALPESGSGSGTG